FLVAKAVHLVKHQQFEKSSKFFLWAIVTGFGFLILKLIEYQEKLEIGLDMEYSTFFMFYWLMTGFHWIHVFVGIIILFFLRRSVRQQKNNANMEDIEAGAAFWHMCDLIWLLLFPILYLLF
ncbi:MAG TPA: cytochrome c oxidase subunit 3, partial [Chitinophagales bacterium]|nr:cytochrome c oxidase subunit 3 [Chitinophagales bacterium]